MNSQKSRWLFWFGLLVFLIAKLYLIIPTTAALSTPRQGDDSLVYLWKGHLAFSSGHGQALRDIEMQRQLPAPMTDETTWMRSNVAQRTMGHITPTYNILPVTALKLIPDLRWAYAATELAGLILMTIGFGWFLFEIAGPAVAGLAMIPLAFAILPNQGIHSFIPSTIALSCSLMLWSYLWRRGEDARMVWVAAFALLIVGLHPIAKVYLALTPALFWVRLRSKDAWRSSAMLHLLVALALAWAVISLVPILVPQLSRPPSAIMGGVDFSGGFIQNFHTAVDLLTSDFLRENILWLTFICIGALLAPRVCLAWPLGWLLAGGLVALLASLFFWLPSYPAELFSRLWVLMYLLGAAFGARFLLSRMEQKKMASYLSVFTILAVLSLIWWVVKYVPSSMNQRNEILEEAVLRQEFSNIPDGNTLLYADTYIGLQASLLLGGDRLGAIAYPMLKGTSDLPRLIERLRPVVAIAPSDTRLNSLAEARSRSYLKRRQGLYFPVVSKMHLYRNTGQVMDEIHFILESPSAICIPWDAFDGNGMLLSHGEMCANPGVASLRVPKGADSVSFDLPDVPAWLLGLSASQQMERRHWPWHEKWHMEYHLRGKRKKPVSIAFTPADLLEKFGAKELTKYLDHDAPVLSDAGGLIFMRTRYHKAVPDARVDSSIHENRHYTTLRVD